MSNKSTIFLTEDNEHWYKELNIVDGDRAEYRVNIKIDKNNIKDFSYSEIDGLIVGVRGDSELAYILRLLGGTLNLLKKPIIR